MKLAKSICTFKCTKTTFETFAAEPDVEVYFNRRAEELTLIGEGIDLVRTVQTNNVPEQTIRWAD